MQSFSGPREGDTFRFLIRHIHLPPHTCKSSLDIELTFLAKECLLSRAILRYAEGSQ